MNKDFVLKQANLIPITSPEDLLVICSTATLEACSKSIAKVVHLITN